MKYKTIEEAFEAGYDKGHYDGFDKGYDIGYDDAYDAGYDDGRISMLEDEE